MAGLLEMPKLPGLPGMPTTTGGNLSSNLESWGLTQDDISAEKRVNKMLQEGNPLLESARQKTLAEYNSRGLLNSSMAAQGATEAMISKALDIANPDAQRALQFGTDYALEGGRNARQKDQQGWQSGENILDRQFKTSEREAGQAWQSGENVLDRNFKTSERLGSQAFTSGENQKTRDFTAGENVLDRNFKTSERLSSQDFTAGQNEKNQTWQSGENVLNRQSQMAQAQLSADTARANAALSAATAKYGADLSAQTQKDIQASGQAFTAAQAAITQDNSFYGEYQTAIRTVQSKWTSQVLAVLQSDLEPAQKDAQIAGIKTVLEGELATARALYENAPRWKSDWATIAVDFGVPTTVGTSPVTGGGGNDTVVGGGGNDTVAAGAGNDLLPNLDYTNEQVASYLTNNNIDLNDSAALYRLAADAGISLGQLNSVVTGLQTATASGGNTSATSTTNTNTTGGTSSGGTATGGGLLSTGGANSPPTQAELDEARARGDSVWRNGKYWNPVTGEWQEA